MPDPVQTKARRRPAEPPRQKRDPERTREAILAAATEAFSRKGLDGARVDEIAARAEANKRMIYHYFGSKEDLYLAVLERAYVSIRAEERELHLEDLAPDAAMRQLIRFSYRYFQRNPEFIHLLNNENLHQARFLKQSQMIRSLHSPLVEMIADILERGRRDGTFKAVVDPVQLYVSIASLGYFYFSNAATLSTIFGRDLGSDAEVAERERHVVGLVMAYLRSEPSPA